MTKKEHRELVIWGVDPFESESLPSYFSISSLFEWQKRSGADIRPVYVLGNSPNDLTVEQTRLPVDRLVSVTKERIEKWLRGYSVKVAHAKPKVVIAPSASITCHVDTLIQEATAEGASWIAVSSKGKAGLPRLMSGSFTETLILRSPLPIWTLGHVHKEKLDFGRILFSTDFSPASQLAFERLLPKVKAIGGSLVVFHAVPPLSGTEPQWGLYASAEWLPMKEIAEELLRKADQEAAAMVAQAEALGIRAKTIIEPTRGAISQMILDIAATEGAEILAMASQSGPLSAAVLGSRARQVVRQSEYPVWVFGPKSLAPDAPLRCEGTDVELRELGI